VGGLAFLVASVAAGGWQVASATPPDKPVTANQGAPGTTPWPVTASGTVNVGNLPATQPVSGTVSVGNFPATQEVSGTVNVGNFPTNLQIGGQTSVLADVAGQDMTPGEPIETSFIDVSTYRSVRVYVSCTPVGGGCSDVGVQVRTKPGATQYALETFQAVDFGAVTKIYDTPGTNFQLALFSHAIGDVTISYTIVGRTN
jgi:hypothetical protein